MILAASGITTLATLALAAAVSLPASPPQGLLGLWLAILTGESLGLRGLLSPPLPLPRRKAPLAKLADPPPLAETTTQPAYSPRVSPHEISQQVQRALTQDQRDSCFGWVRAHFHAQQRTENLHLAFCPPFLTTPTVDLQQLDGPPLQIKAAQVLPYGARVELRLARASDQPVTATIGFTAVEQERAGAEGEGVNEGGGA